VGPEHDADEFGGTGERHQMPQCGDYWTYRRVIFNAIAPEQGNWRIGQRQVQALVDIAATANAAKRVRAGAYYECQVRMDNDSFKLVVTLTSRPVDRSAAITAIPANRAAYLASADGFL